MSSAEAAAAGCLCLARVAATIAVAAYLGGAPPPASGAGSDKMGNVEPRGIGKAQILWAEVFIGPCLVLKKFCKIFQPHHIESLDTYMKY